MKWPQLLVHVETAEMRGASDGRCPLMSLMWLGTYTCVGGCVEFEFLEKKRASYERC